MAKLVAWPTKINLTPASGLLITLAVFGLPTAAKKPTNFALAESSRVVSLYFDGQKKVVTTDADHVSHVLDRAGITLNNNDIVEPAADTFIPQGFFNINIYRSRPVMIVDGANVIRTTSAYESPRLIASGAGLTVYPEDEFNSEIITNFAADHFIGPKITLVRALPVTIKADGNLRSLRTQAHTVKELLDGQNVAIGLKDVITPGLADQLTAGTTVVIVRVGEAEITVNEVLPHATKVISDSTQYRGYHAVQVPGSDGHRVVTYKINYRDGVEVSRQTLGVADQVDPVTRIEVVGTKVYYASDMEALGGRLAAARGWDGDEWDALDQLWLHESNWNPTSYNGSGPACGIPQANPCSKLPGWSPLDPAAQINWGLDYIARIYGDPIRAWAHWQVYRSY